MYAMYTNCRILVSRVFEKLINNRIVDHIEKCSLFSGFQYGFRSSWSTANLLTVVSDKIVRDFNWCGATWTVALAISKAFERVWHAHLLNKRKSFEIPSQTCGFISSFLNNGRLRVVVDRKSSQGYWVNTGVPQGFILGPTLFWLYINGFPGYGICSIAIYVDDTTLYSKCDQSSNLWQQLEFASELESDLWDTVDWGRKWLADSNAGKTQLVLFDQSSNTEAIDMKIYGPVLEEKSSLKMLGLTSIPNWIGALTLSLLLKSISMKFGTLTCSMKFLCPKVALYLYQLTIQPCMEYFCHALAGAPSCFLELLDKLQKQIGRTVGPLLAACLWTLGLLSKCRQYKFFYNHYFDRSSFELTQHIQFPYSWVRSMHYSDRFQDFSVIILVVTRMSTRCQQFLSSHK